MLDILYLCFAWLPTPLNIMAFGLFALLVLFVVVRVIALVLDVIPFL